jgi:hypothetical protein
VLGFAAELAASRYLVVGRSEELTRFHLPTMLTFNLTRLAAGDPEFAPHLPHQITSCCDYLLAAHRNHVANDPHPCVAL